MFGLTHIIKCPTYITCKSTTLTNYTLASALARIFQEGIMNVSYQNINPFIALGKLAELKLKMCTKLLNSVNLRITQLMLIKMLLRK